jgi:hypothetical protein
MDTDPLQAQNSPAPQEPNNKKRELILSVILVVILVIGAYFLITRNTNTKNPGGSNNQSQSNYNLSPADKLVLEKVNSAYLAKPYLENRSNIYINTTDYYIPLKEGSASFSYCDGDSSCAATSTKQGNVTLSNISLPSDPSFLMAPNAQQPAGNGVAVLTFNFDNKDTAHYLGVFQLHQNPNDIKNYLEFYPTKDLGNLSGSIENVAITDKEEVTVTIKDSSGTLSSKIFSVMLSSRFGSLIELTSDKKYKIYNDKDLGYSFVYPKYIDSFSNTSTLEATPLEGVLGMSPIYYAQECGLQPTFADSEISYASSTYSNSVWVTNNIQLDVHKVKDPVVYLSTALYGYDPLDWGKVKQTITMKDYLNNIKVGAPVSGRDVKLEDIQGHTVRHIMPFTTGRPCDTQNREQYQWVTGNLLFSLNFAESKEQPFPVQEKTELINSIFSSLKVNN